jgi:hypothetical protein
MMGGNLKDQAGSGDISLLLKDRVTQLKEVVAHWTKYQTFMEGLVQRLDILDQHIGAPSPFALVYSEPRVALQMAASGPFTTSYVPTSTSTRPAAIDTTTVAATSPANLARI